MTARAAQKSKGPPKSRMETQLEEEGIDLLPTSYSAILPLASTTFS